MNADLLAQWEREAFVASETLCALVDQRVASPIDLVLVPLENADGSNSADRAYVERLVNRQHLTDGFLSDQ